MVTGLLLSETVCFDRWKTHLPFAYCLAASWQRRCGRWLANSRIDAQALYGPLILWSIQYWQKPGHTLHLALDTTVLWNRCCLVVLSVVCHGRAIPLVWQTLEHPSASVSASVSIALLEKADQLLIGFGAITLLADRAFPCDELIAWFRGRPRWSYVMRLRGDTEIHGTAAPLGCQVRRLQLRRGPVLDTDGRLLGVLSLSSLARAVTARTCDLSPTDIATTLACICGPRFPAPETSTTTGASTADTLQPAPRKGKPTKAGTAKPKSAPAKAAKTKPAKGAKPKARAGK